MDESSADPSERVAREVGEAEQVVRRWMGNLERARADLNRPAACVRTILLTLREERSFRHILEARFGLLDTPDGVLLQHPPRTERETRELWAAFRSWRLFYWMLRHGEAAGEQAREAGSDPETRRKAVAVAMLDAQASLVPLIVGVGTEEETSVDDEQRNRAALTLAGWCRAGLARGRYPRLDKALRDLSSGQSAETVLRWHILGSLPLAWHATDGRPIGELRNRVANLIVADGRRRRVGHDGLCEREVTGLDLSRAPDAEDGSAGGESWSPGRLGGTALSAAAEFELRESARMAESRLNNLLEEAVLSPRERQVIALICEDHEEAEIAVALGISLAAVYTHTSNARAKLRRSRTA